MSVWQAILLGAVQGLTEFLPVSSSGHLILAERILGIKTDGSLFFDITLHLGTLIPVCIVFSKSIKGLFKKPYKTLVYLIVASLPAAIVGFVFNDTIEVLFKGGGYLSAVLLGFSFTMTSVELLFAEKFSAKSKNVLPLSLKSSIIMGVFQSFAIIPGLSRSGTVITGGTVAKLDKDKNAEFAFLMSIPVILGATAISGIKAVNAGADIEVLPVIFGVVSAAVFGYMAINVMLAAIRKTKFGWFSLYLILLAAISVLTKVIFGV